MCGIETLNKICYIGIILCAKHRKTCDDHIDRNEVERD